MSGRILLVSAILQMVSSSEAPTNKTPTKEQEELIKLLHRMDVPRFGGPGAEYFPPPPPPRPIRPPSSPGVPGAKSTDDSHPPPLINAKNPQPPPLSATKYPKPPTPPTAAHTQPPTPPPPQQPPPPPTQNPTHSSGLGDGYGHASHHQYHHHHHQQQQNQCQTIRTENFRLQQRYHEQQIEILKLKEQVQRLSILLSGRARFNEDVTKTHARENFARSGYSQPNPYSGMPLPPSTFHRTAPYPPSQRQSPDLSPIMSPGPLPMHPSTHRTISSETIEEFDVPASVPPEHGTSLTDLREKVRKFLQHM